MVYNKLLLATLLFFGISATMLANKDVPKVKAQLNEATIFFQGAELSHKATATLAKGDNELWITGLSPQIDINSLKINTNKGVVVSAFEYAYDYINVQTLPLREKALTDSLEYYNNKIEECNISITTNGDLLALLKANNSIAGSEKGLNVTELIRMVDYYSAKSNELNKSQSKLRKEVIRLSAGKSKIEEQLRQEAVKNRKSVGILKLSMTSPLATSANISVSYYTKYASWTPYYDINIPGAGQQINLATKAKVAQSTGLDWEKVKLTLSTSTPSNGKVAPLFNAWFLDFVYTPDFEVRAEEKLSQNSHSYDEIVIAPGYASKKSISAPSIGASVYPLYIVNGEISTMQEVSGISANMIESTIVLNPIQAMEIYGNMASAGARIITTKAMTDFVERTDSELNMTYEIDLPYTILGNAKVVSIDLRNDKLNATFKHYAIPKLDTETFILAEVAEWQKLGLLSGKASVTFDGTYVGETMINAQSTASTLSLTLGTDKRVSVKREKTQSYSSRKAFGKDIKQEFSYKTTVRNNQTKPITIVVKDQYPLTNQKEIEVELSKETTPTTHTNSQVGVLVWEVELAPGEKKEFNTIYTVKYPKDKPINLN